MKAEELRIGNLVRYNYGSKTTYGTIDILDLRMLSGEVKMKTVVEISPIPLTEEWLGREPSKVESWKGNGQDYQPETSKTSQNWYWLKEDVYLVFETWSYRKTESDEWINEKNILIGNHSDLNSLIKNEVHILQNKFYFDYGEELTIKD